MEQAQQTLKCIELEKQAHSREGGSHGNQNGFQQKSKRDSPSSSPDYDPEDKEKEKYGSTVKKTQNLKGKEALKNLKTDSHSV